MPPQDLLHASTKKHRACDECRQRKLACSKAPNGCDRCIRENVVCHYSEQMPMGRPRKRQIIEVIAQDQISTQNQDPQDLSSLLVGEFEAYNGGSVAEPFYTTTPQLNGAFLEAPELEKSVETSRVLWHFGDHELMAGPPIDFGDVGSEQSTLPPLESISNPSISDSDNSPTQSVTGPCCCLASMYLSLAALQQFPKDIVSALKTVRGAAATAAQSLWCRQCGSVLMETATPPIESFQNTMLLGTIIPIIANGYASLLTMIDKETDLATAAGQMKIFNCQDYGGLVSNQESMQDTGCDDKKLLLDAVEMPPAQWRTTVRALLRVDIYGHEQNAFKHKGLKDLVSEMEYRQRTRHEIMDAQEAAGTLDTANIGHGVFAHGEKCLGEKTRGCLVILKMAKIAIDNLVIA